MNGTQKPDRLSGFLRRFEVKAGVFHTGALCGTADFQATERGGHLHVLREGCLRVTNEGKPAGVFGEPTVLFYPRSLPHRLDAEPADSDVELLCAGVDFGGGANPLALALPAMIAVPVSQSEGLRATLDLLIEEAFSVNCGRQAVLDRLCEVVVVKLLRYVVGRKEIELGLVAGLSHDALCRALAAIHDAPERDWTLERLAGIAGMSRTTFANTFRDVVGQTPGQYLAGWRLTLARGQLSEGRPLKSVARAVGYASTAALSRAYSRRFGRSPRQARSAGSAAL